MPRIEQPGAWRFRNKLQRVRAANQPVMAVHVQERPPFSRPKDRLPEEQAAFGPNAKVIENGWKDVHMLADARRIDAGEPPLRMEKKQRHSILAQSIQIF